MVLHRKRGCPPKAGKDGQGLVDLMALAQVEYFRRMKIDRHTAIRKAVGKIRPLWPKLAMSEGRIKRLLANSSLLELPSGSEEGKEGMIWRPTVRKNEDLTQEERWQWKTYGCTGDIYSLGPGRPPKYPKRGQQYNRLSRGGR